ncbi:MAG TPA: ATP synthase F0 subunit B [Methylomirabilota bacterium]|nr:ATP synthase F0 subunit B [Methylomirabilota bacterium]
MPSVSPSEIREKTAGTLILVQEILRQLEQLFLQAVPTVILVFLFYFFMRWSFFGPMERILAERRARIEGAQQAAQSSRAAAQEKVRAYREAIKDARAELFAEQEGVRRRAVEQRDGVVLAARRAAHEQVLAAKRELQLEVERAKATLEESSAALGLQIAEAFLRPGPREPREGAPGA